MALTKTTLTEIRKKGVEALTRALGPVGMVRFLQQFEGGSGDYTRERDGWLKDLNVEEMVQEIKSRRKKHNR